MIRRKIANRDVNAVGLGCMGMSAFYGAPMSDKDGIALIHAALDRGVDHFDTAELYADNERLLGLAFEGKRDKAFIATKFGPIADPVTKVSTGVDGSEANARRAVENSLRFLKTDHIDLYYLHRKDPARSIEETVGAMAKLKQEGKINAIGLSEVNAATLRAAHKVHPIAAVQIEYSLFTRHIEQELMPACKELGVTIVAYSPLGRGMLTGAIKKDFKPTGPDFRAMGALAPRFAGEAFDANLALVEEIEAVAKAKGANAGQVALAWVLSHEGVVVIPGTTKLANLESNLAAADVKLTAEENARLEALAAKVQGARYGEQGMRLVDA